MDLLNVLETNDFILTEAAIIEKLRRSARITLHPRLENALLIYEDSGRKTLEKIHNEFIDTAYRASVPINITTPTWRANKERVTEAGRQKDINKDAVEFIKALRCKWHHFSSKIFIGGLIGCQNDCYQPAQGLQTEQAYSFHSWQIEKLAKEGVDFLLAATLPSVSEAAGISLAMEKTGIPYFISFVINRSGKILDGTRLERAFNEIDSKCTIPPTGYMINCAYPSFLNPQNQPKALFKRLTGFQANASSLDHGELDGSQVLHSDALPDWGDRMIALNTEYGIKILGGCCGTNVNHLRYLAEKLKKIDIYEQALYK